MIAAAEPGDFSFVTDLEVDNVGSSNAALRMVRVPVNLSNYVGSNLITAVCNDRIFETANGLATTSGFTQDCNVNAAGAWVWTTSTPSTIETPRMYHGGSDADDGFPLVGGNNDGLGAAIGGHSPLRATSTAVIQIGDLLDIRLDISAYVPCGTIVYKVGSNVQTPTGYGMWAIGDVSVAAGNAIGGAAGNTAIYIRMTPLNFDAWICSVGSVQSFTDWVKGGTATVQIQEVDSALEICRSDNSIPVNMFPYIVSTQIQVILNSPCLVKQGTEYRIIVSGVDMGDSTFAYTATTTDGNFFFETSGVNEAGAEPWRAQACCVPPNVTYIRDSLLGTSTGAFIGAMVDSTWEMDVVAADWDGERATLQIDYTDPDFDVLINGIVEFTITEAGGIATSSGDLDIGRGFHRGTLYNFELDAGVTTVMDFDFDGDDIFEATQGNSANAFQWTGLINNEGTATTTPLEYVLTYDDTNINTSVTGFMNNPTATPVGGGFSTSTGLTGDPSINPLFTPFPTTSGGMIIGPLRTAANASSLPPQTWWLLVLTVFFSMILGFVHKFFPNRVIFAAMAVVLFAIASISIGSDMPMWLVGLFALWAFGSTTILIKGNR